MMHLQEDFFHSFDGTRIFYRMALPPKEIKSVVVCVHGWSEHSGHYKELIENLVNAGFAVYAPDLRGYGRSQGQRGYILEWKDYLQDLYFLIGIARKLHEKTKIFLLGHSMGCVVGIRFIQTYTHEISLSGLILSAPMLKYAIKVPEIKIKLGKWMSKWLPRFSLPNPIPGEKLTHDTHKIAQIKADPYFHFKANSRWYTESLKAMSLCFKNIEEITIPTLILHGTEDEVNAIEGSQDFFDALEVRDKEFVVLKDMRHALFDEIDRVNIFSKVCAWITKRSLK